MHDDIQPCDCRPFKCSITKASWSPQIGAQQALRPGTTLATGTAVSIDDKIQISADWNCQIQQPAYASVTFIERSGRAAVFLLTADKAKASRLKGSIGVADLATKVHTALTCKLQLKQRREPFEHTSFVLSLESCRIHAHFPCVHNSPALSKCREIRLRLHSMSEMPGLCLFSSSWVRSR
jgi:hypothetical protein